MKITYSILWFDDDPAWFDSLDLDPLKEAIRAWGFEPDIQFAPDAAGFMAKAPFSEIDLIVVDYNLGGDQEHGEAFIKKIRDHDILTEVVFYSAAGAPELWEAVRTWQLEGVYVTNRQGVSDKVQKVGHQSVRKVLDVNMMRGIVMAEVGDLDLVIDEIVAAALPALEASQRDKIFSNFGKNSLKQANGQREALEKFSEAPTAEEMILLSDSNKRWDNLKRVMRVHSKLAGQTVGDFVSEVLFPRNCLAHGTPRLSGSSYIFSFRGKEYTYDHPESVRLRRKILEYRQLFHTFRALVGVKPDKDEAAFA
jgi:hypothetical protein